MKTCTKCGLDWPLSGFYRGAKGYLCNVCKECMKARDRLRYQAKRDELNAARNARRRANPEHEAKRARAWQVANAHKVASYVAKRKALKLRATPSWADLPAIQSFYEEAAALGYEVDHIVPLRGRNVCGLHVQSNLQLLTKSVNAAKGNRFAG